MSDISDGAEWTEMDIEDLKSAVAYSRSLEELPSFYVDRPTMLRANARNWG
jgi:hypothetical protein